MTAPFKPIALKVTASLVAASLAALALIAAIDSASAALPTKRTLYQGALINKATGASEGSIRLKVKGSNRVVGTVVASSQPCVDETTVSDFDSIQISTNGAFSFREQLDPATSVDLSGKFKSKKKATGEFKIKVRGTDCETVDYKFVAKKGGS